MYVCIALYLCFVLLQKSFTEKDVECVSVSLLCIVTEELRWERRWGCVCIFALYCYRRASPRKTLRVCLYLCFVLLQKSFTEKDVEGVSVSLLCIVTEELCWERHGMCVGLAVHLPADVVLFTGSWDAPHHPCKLFDCKEQAMPHTIHVSCLTAKNKPCPTPSM